MSSHEDQTLTYIKHLEEDLAQDKHHIVLAIVIFIVIGK